MMYQDLLPINLDLQNDAIIKVMGIGGGGCNAVNYMYKKGIKDVTFLVCNTDKQALGQSSIPAKLQLGPGLGAGGKPEVAEGFAEENRDRIKEALDDGTKMLFITAGMGGGTGTGASATVAEVAQSMNILTVGIVTIPFAFEGQKKIKKAMTGVAKLAGHVDAILIINNDKLTKIYPDLNMLNAFTKSDDVVCNAAKAIAEIITIPGYINTDFADVYNTLKDGQVAIMNIGTGEGENRITNAIQDALRSPLVNTNDVKGAKRVLMQFYCSTEGAIQMGETEQIHAFVQQVGDEVEVQWGISIDEELGNSVRVTLIATGYEVNDIPSLTDADKPSVDEAVASNYPVDEIQDGKEDETKDNHQPDSQQSTPDTPITNEIDLTPTLVNPNPKATNAPKTMVKQGGEIVIDFTTEEDGDNVEPSQSETPAEESRPRVGLGWLRGRRN